MYTLMSQQTLAIILLLVCIIPIAILIVLAIVIRLKRSSEERKTRDEKVAGEEIDQEQRKLFLDAYGGESNVKSVTIERNRINIECEDVNLVDGEALKALGAVNVYITGNDVKCSYGDRAEYVYNTIK